MSKKIFTIILIVLYATGLYSQEKLPDVIITDTIYKDVLKTSHILVEKCPGFLSGLPCLRFIQHMDNLKFSKKNIITNDKKIFYKLSKDGIIVLDINEMANYQLLFKGLKIDNNNKKSMELSKCIYNKKKIAIQEATYSNVMIYVAKVRLSKLNEILFTNIMVQTKEEYVNTYLIYN